VRKSKSEAGTDRRPPIAQTLRPILRGAWLRQGQPVGGAVSAVSVMSRKLAIRATKAWKHAPTALERNTLRVPAQLRVVPDGSRLHAQGDHRVHGPFEPARRYVKLLPQPAETDPAQRLNAYLARRATS
jgi:hypothetical protein